MNFGTERACTYVSLSRDLWGPRSSHGWAQVLGCDIEAFEPVRPRKGLNVDDGGGMKAINTVDWRDLSNHESLKL